METRTGKVFGKTILTLSKWRVNVFSYIVGCSNAFSMMNMCSVIKAIKCVV